MPISCPGLMGALHFTTEYRSTSALVEPGMQVLSKGPLQFLAGAGAYKEVREHGFDPSRIGTIAGASGGAKWLVLSQLDRIVISRIFPCLRGPVHLVGSSIGAWRMACYAHEKPLQAIEKFEDAYLTQTYSEKPTRSEITATSRRMLDSLAGEEGAGQILNNPLFRTSVVTVRCRGLLATENRLLLAAGLVSAAGLNAINRSSLGTFFERVLFYDSRDQPPFFGVGGFPLHQVVLTEENLVDAILASGSIPLVLNGITDIAGAPPGNYRDGGIIDYHLDLPLSDAGRLTLFPHFYPYLVPGWFDKRLQRRRASAVNTKNTIVVCPSAEFVSQLPNKKIPDRTDFTHMSPDDRVAIWRGVVKTCEALADDLCEVLDNGSMAARLEEL